jgi:hypothetical protein
MNDDMTEMRSATERALISAIEAADRLREAETNKTPRHVILEAFDNLGQCLADYGDKDLSARLGDIAVEFDMRHTPVAGI